MVKPERLEMQSADGVQLNLDALYQIAPSCFTEAEDPKTGKIKRMVNFTTLRQLLGDETVEDAPEAYEFNWVGKQAARADVLRPIKKTLRPVLEDSVDWDNTENLYIEGDNLEVLKLLQKSYLGKVKMIYIDPPYNTGNDFVYHDKFARSQEEEDLEAGNIDDLGNRYIKNTDSNGKYHSDWCSMIYSRLLVSRTLLRNDGVIFISIDNNEISNITKICNELFGESNCLGIISNINNPKGRSDDKYVATAHEYLLVYAKNIEEVDWYGFEPTEEITKRYNKVDNNQNKYREIDLRKTGENDLREDRPNLFYYFMYNESTGDFYPTRENLSIDGYICIKPQREDGKEGNWRWGIDTSKEKINDLIPKFMPSRKVWGVMQKDYLEGRSLVKPTSSWTFKDVNSERGTEQFINLGFDKRIFPKPKPLGTLERCCKLSTDNNGSPIILDFFSGSATTAHAIMKLNSEDCGSRKFIMVQLPEPTQEDSDAYKAGYKNICEIGKERIRRAGKQIKEESPLTTQDLDTGFRVFRVDSSNFEEVEHTPKDWNQDQLDIFLNNIKADRDDLDLLFGCLLDWGVKLSLPMTSEEVDGKMIYTVNEGDLVACFADKVTDNVVKAMADKFCVLRAVLDISACHAFFCLNDGDERVEIIGISVVQIVVAVLWFLHLRCEFLCCGIRLAYTSLFCFEVKILVEGNVLFVVLIVS